MTEPLPLQCLMIGLPASGKTTFLAALWHVARSHEVGGSMRLERREGDQEYLNAIAKAWSGCSELPRTPGEGETGVALLLRDPQGDRLVRLSIPDMTGESFKVQWETRQCTRTFAELVGGIGGCLLFVHPANVFEPRSIVDANATLNAWAGPSDDSPQDADADFADWDAAFAPTQVQLVDLLQFLSELAGRRVRLGVVVSAWDLVGGDVDPEAWVKTALPLLWQYVTTNPALYSAGYLGVSAQGGERSNEALLECGIASHRIRVRAAGGEEHDITEPIRWLMDPATDS